MRAFIGIDIPDEIKESLFRVQKTLMESGIEGTPVKKHNFHWTIKFLGEINQTQCDKIKEALEGLVSQISVEIKGIGAFPNSRHPNVIWAGTENKDLLSLIERIEDRLSSLGFGKEMKDSIPHITLLRCKQNRNMDLPQKTLKDMREMPIGTQNIESITLYKSVLTSDGPIYEKIWSLEI